MNAVLEQVDAPVRDRHYLGGGNVAGILGVSPYKTPLQEYLTIVGEAEAPSAERLSFFRRRKSFEPVAAELFQEKTGLQLVTVNERYTDHEHAFIKAEIDAETAGGENVEIKTVHPLAARDWGEEGADDCPVYVTAQAQHGLMVRARDLCYVLAMIGFDDVRVYRVERDEEIIATLRKREIAFWQEHVLTRTPPPPANVEDLRVLYRRDAGNAIEATPEIVERIARLVDLTHRAKELEGAIGDEKEAIQLFMRDAAAVTINGKPAITWKSQTSNRFDQAGFKAAHPDLFEKFKAASESRVFRIK